MSSTSLPVSTAVLIALYAEVAMDTAAATSIIAFSDSRVLFGTPMKFSRNIISKKSMKVKKFFEHPFEI